MTPKDPRPSVGFFSLGCAKNLVDSEIMAAAILKAGFCLAPSPDQATVVLVNTCAFIGDAKTESIQAILEACQYKKSGGPCKAVIVAGCLPQRYREELQQSVPEADAFMGVDDLKRLPSVIRQVLTGRRARAGIPRGPAHAVIEPPRGRPLFTGSPYAYLKIAEGCNHGCSFCAIPGIRGRYRSRPIRSIVAEAEDLLGRGIRELNLISQDTTRYGCELSPATDIAHLIRALGRIGGRFWIRLLYGHPNHVSPAMLKAMADTPQACHYLDLPIQHCHPAVLKAMRRPSSPARLKQLFKAIRTVLPDAALRTTCLVGFPGETEAQFQTLLDFITDVQFQHVCAFAYSPEDHTAAIQLPHPVPRRTALRRKSRLLAVQQPIAFDLAKTRLGLTDEVLVEKLTPDQRQWQARSRYLAPDVDGVIRLPAQGTLAPGDFVTATYTRVKGYDWLAEPTNRRPT